MLTMVNVRIGVHPPLFALRVNIVMHQFIIL